MNYRLSAEKKWQKIRNEYPLVAKQYDSLSASEEERTLLLILCAGLEIRDLVSLEPEEILGFVRESLKARSELNYAADVPDELFYDYVLPFRVNNEYPDGSRGWLYEQIKERVRGKSMLDAALEVNYWCCEHATYQSTDDRTIGPLGMCRRGKGRCGEESTLLVSALRAVGIPARQVYVPYWSHCDDNHAWVEFWAEGQWYYMGACEPEPVSNIGWFQSAASRAMLVRSRVPDMEAECGYRTVNSTALYADTTFLRVCIRKAGKAVSNVQVRLQIINESRLVTLHSEITDESGCIGFETGHGCLIVSAFFDGHLIEQLIDLRNCQEVILNWEDGLDPLSQEHAVAWELIPPKEKLPPFYEADAIYNQRLRQCDEMRLTHVKTLGQDSEIEKFLNLSEFSVEDKESLLSLLSEKDLADVSCDTLTDYLSESLSWKRNYPREIWEREILSPRVEYEMLLPIRSKIRNLLKYESLNSEDDVRDWMKRNLRSVSEYGLTDRRGNAAQYVRYRICPESEWDILAVQICRALGISAISERKGNQTIRMTVSCDETLRWRENWSLGKWEAGEYRVLNHPQDLLSPGSYSLITSRRQIDGTVSARAERYILTEDREITVYLQPDQTADKLKSVPLAGFAQQEPSLLLFLQPGAEPTEHLLLEILELRDQLNRGAWPIRMLVQEIGQLENDTFQKVLQEIQNTSWGTFNREDQYRIQQAMGIGDARLPLAIVTDRLGNGVYGCANYNIRSAHTMVRILNMIDK